jgi:hypothetical protein
MSDLVDQLLAKPGLYFGTQVTPHAGGDGRGVARVVVTPLPGGAGVSFDYEVLTPDNGRNHAEHAVLARGPEGLFIVTAHSHAPVATVVQETSAGYFLAGEDDAPFPMAIGIKVPEPGHLIYEWSYGRPGEELQVADVGDVRLVED